MPDESLDSRRRTPISRPWLVAGLVLLGGLAPPALYQLFLLGVRQVTAEEAKRLLRSPQSRAVLVDLRPADTFRGGHIDGAVNWRPGEDLPGELRGRPLLLLCEAGLSSVGIARRLNAAGAEAISVRGGIQEWIRSAAVELTPCRMFSGTDRLQFLRHTPPPEGGRFDRWISAAGEIEPLSYRPSPLGEQFLAVASFFLIKPLYTLLSLAAAIVLWRSRAPDLVALRWSMIAFFLGENACAANYFVFRETSYLFEYLHSFGMLVSFSLASFALLEGLDRRVLGLSDSDRRCAATSLCGRCIKHAPVPCGLRRAFLILIPGLMAIALVLPTSDWQGTSYNTSVFGQLYNYAHLYIYQVFENWYCAAAAVLALGISLILLVWGGQAAIAPAKLFFAAGVGPLGFGLLRCALGGLYDENRVWYLFWEEFTELLFIAGVVLLLWNFRSTLLRSKEGHPGPTGSRAVKDDG